jgi:hypothetical protein
MLRSLAAQQQISRGAEDPFPARDFAQVGQTKRGYFHRANCRKAGVIIGARIQSRAALNFPVRMPPC